MERAALREIFDRQAASYDQRESNPLCDALHLLVQAIFSDLPENAQVLCVGAGTGAELLFLARQFPHWRFTVVEPSEGMLEVCRCRVEEEGIAPRCTFHQGYLESLPISEKFDAATALLVSQFMLDREARSEFFRDIARRLRPGGMLASADLSFEIDSSAYLSLLEVWLRAKQSTEVTSEMLERLRIVYGRDVAVLPPEEVEDIITSGGFERPIPFYQAGLVRGWYATRC